MRRYFKTWQDYVIGVGGAVLVPSLIPMILAEIPPPLLSSIPTTVVLWAFAVSFATLKLPLSSISTSLTAAM